MDDLLILTSILQLESVPSFNRTHRVVTKRKCFPSYIANINYVFLHSIFAYNTVIVTKHVYYQWEIDWIFHQYFTRLHLLSLNTNELYVALPLHSICGTCKQEVVIKKRTHFLFIRPNFIILTQMSTLSIRLGKTQLLLCPF